MGIKLKYVSIILFILISGCQLQEPAPLVEIKFSDNKKNKLIKDLNTALFTDISNPELDSANHILAQIISSKDSTFIPLLQPIRDKVQTTVFNEFQPFITHQNYNVPMVSIKWNIAAAVHQLYLYKGSIPNLKEEYDRTFESIDQIMAELPKDASVELKYLRDKATEFTPFLLETIDDIETSARKKYYAIHTLRYSNFPTLESEVLKRIEKFNESHSDWMGLAFVLSNCGSDKSIKFLLNKYKSTKKINHKETILYVLKILSYKSIEDEGLFDEMNLLLEENADLFIPKLS